MATSPKKTSTAKGKPSARNTPERAKDGTFKKHNNGSHWGTAAIVGGVAAVGAVATAALFALRGSSALESFEESWSSKRDERGSETTGASLPYDQDMVEEDVIPA